MSRATNQGSQSGSSKKNDKTSGTLNVPRFYFLFSLFALLGLLVMGRLLYIQLVDAENLQHKARLIRNQSMVLFNRGRILDRRGVILAQDTLLYDLFAHPRYYQKTPPKQIAHALSPVLKIKEETLIDKLSEPGLSTIGVIKNIHKNVVDQILKTRLDTLKLNSKTMQPIIGEDGRPLIAKIPIPGLDFSKKTVRNYPQGNLAAHLLGYVNDEANVSSGLESSLKHILKKAPPNIQTTEFSGKGEFIHLEDLSPERIVTLPKAEDVTLTLDARLQYFAERELALGIQRTKAKRGSVVMMNPKTGEILAFAVFPSYSPETFYKEPAEILKNWAITDVYPPGSTFKILTVACGLETGVIDTHTKIQDTGKMTIGGWNIQNYDYHKHGAPGMIDLVYLFQHSSNIASAKISMMMNPEKHRNLLKAFGMGSKTNIDLPGESRGIMRSLEEWDQTTHATIGFGYGLASTPIQMAAAVGALANKGVWITPHLVKNNRALVKRRVVSEKTAAEITQLLAQSIETAKNSTVRLEGFRVAGKTGTSRKPKENGRGYDNTLFTSFVGYFPAEDPKLLMMVVVDSPGIGEAWGSTVAGPIFSAIAQESITYLGLKPAKIASSIIKKGDPPPEPDVLTPSKPSSPH
ncbi:MAG: penicillin-binding protein 2 [Cyanobacteria bacterium]|nr:penicillin-binding protein 2 [Cyanobacteriota bacterium]